MPKRRIEVANFAEGIKAFPAYEQNSGRAGRRMLNYVVNPDGEPEPRPGFVDVSNDIHVTHLNSLGAVDNLTPETGPLAICRNSQGNTRYYRLPEGSSWVQEGDRLFYTTRNANREGYWVDILTNNIYQWTSSDRPDDLGIDNVRIESISSPSQGLSHPLFIGLTGTAPTSENPIRMFFQTGSDRPVSGLEIRVVVDVSGGSDTEFLHYKITPNDLPTDTRVEILWDGIDSDDGGLTYNITTGEKVKTPAGSVSKGGHPRTRYRPGGGSDDYIPKYITQAQFEDSFLEVEYDVDGHDEKFRYYLFSHRENDTSGQISTAIQSGLSVGSIASAIPGVGTGAALGTGAVVATAGVIGSLIARAGEGERVQIQPQRRDITPAQVNETGFFSGLYIFCYTFSDTPSRGIESLPSKIESSYIFEFENLRDGARQEQLIDFDLPDANTIPEWAECLNIYAAKSASEIPLEELPQATGLEFRLIGQAQSEMGHNTWYGDGVFEDMGEYYVRWQDEGLVEPHAYLNTTDNDAPTSTLDGIVSYGSRIWGVDKEDNSISYSKVGRSGYYFFPKENALVAHNFELEDSQWPIIKIHPAPNDSMLYVFKERRIQYIRGHGEVQGLHSPATPLDVTLDASLKNESVGTLSPNSVTTFKNRVLFLGTDHILYELAGVRVSQFSISIQPIIKSYQYTDEELQGVFGFEWENRFHLSLPASAHKPEGTVLVIDLEQGGYWTMFDWELDTVADLYAYHADGRLIQLYEGLDDAGDSFPREWESNPVKVPYETVVTGMYVYHRSEKNPITVGLKVVSEGHDGEFTEKSYKPARSNRYRQGFHEKGQRVAVLVRDENPISDKLIIDRIEIEV